ncbi:MAG: hypothetical protein ACOCXT_00440 [Candidatus Dojkabacteria bacterium]
MEDHFLSSSAQFVRLFNKAIKSEDTMIIAILDSEIDETWISEFEIAEI